MQIVRTTLRLNKELRKMAEGVALKENTILQNIFNQALLEYLAKRKSKGGSIIIKSVPLGLPDKIFRDDIYGKPDFSGF